MITLPRKTITLLADAAAALNRRAEIVATANILRRARGVREKDVDADSKFFRENDSQNRRFSFARFVPNVIL